MNEIKKIFCNLTYWLYIGGIESYIKGLILKFYKKNFNFDIGSRLIKKDAFAEELKQYNVTFYQLQNSFNSPLDKIKYLLGLYKILRRNKYCYYMEHQDIFGSIFCMIAFFAGVKKRIQFIHMQNNRNRIKTILYRILSFLFVTQRLAVSKKAGLSQYGNLLKFDVIKIGVDTKSFMFNNEVRCKKRKELNIENKFVFGNICRFSKEKNLFFLLDVLCEIKKVKDNAILVLIGSGELYDMVKLRIKELNLEEYVLLLGEKKDVNLYYQAMDCFVFPSLHEGLGISVIEAQCSGIPCFISDGVPDDAMICNTTKIPLSKSAKEWANIILEKTKNFERKDCSDIVKEAGFDFENSIKQLEKYL